MKTKNHSDEGDSRIDQNDTETPPRKKLKQARLPFQILLPGVETPSQSLKSNNKRKLESSDDVKIVKIVRPNESSQLCETKENVSDDSKNSADKVIVQCASKESECSVSDTITSQSGGGNSASNIKNTDPKIKTESKHEESFKCEDTVDVIIISDNEESLLKNSLNTDRSSITVEQKKDVFNVETSTTLHLRLSDDEDSNIENTPITTETSFEGIINKINSSAEDCDAGNSAADKSEQCTPINKLLSHKDRTDSNDNSSKSSNSLENTPKIEDNIEKSTVDSVHKTRRLIPKQLQKQFESGADKPEQCTSVNKSLSHKDRTDSTDNSSNSLESTPKIEDNIEKSTIDSVRKTRRLISKQLQKQLESAADKPEQCTSVNKSLSHKDRTDSTDNSSKSSNFLESTPKIEDNIEKSTSHSTVDSVHKTRRLISKQLQKQLESAADKTEQCTSINKSPLHKDRTDSSDNSSKSSNSLESTPKNEDIIEKSTSHSNVDSVHKTRKLTPKQLQKQLDSAKKKEEKERLRQEREKKKAEEKEEREKKKAEEKEEKLKQKQEKEEQKKKEKEEREEQKRKEKEEREEQKKKEKEEKERKKQIELELKNEEKRKKEDKRQAEVAAFTSFFLPKKAELKPLEELKIKVEENFMPFEVKADMRLAPKSRNSLTSKLKSFLDEALIAQNKEKLYLDQLRQKEITSRYATSTWALSDIKDDIIILEDDEIPNNVAAISIIETYAAAGQMPRPKLLQFWENRRPPYWGTWRKKSSSITPVKPFIKDEKYFDYEVDSDDEWEEEEPGESLHGSEDEKESEDEYEVDNDFFVPHGYLSDEEHEGEEDEVQSPEMMKAKLKLLELEFEEEMKQKTERLKPRLIGCIWIDPKNTDAVGGQLLKLLSPYQAVYQGGPVSISAPEPVSTSVSPESNISTPATPAAKRKKFPPEGVPALIRLIHGNINRREFLIKEFIAYWKKEQQKLQGETSIEKSVEETPSTSHGDIIKRSVSIKIKELATWVACPEEGPMYGRMCWYVPPETREAHGLSDLSLPNTTWTYTIKPKRRESDIQVSNCSPASTGESTPKQLITKFTKPMTEVELKKQFTGSEGKSGNCGSSHSEKTQRKLLFSSVNKGNTSNNSVENRKKVPILMSGPMGEELPKSTTFSLMKFMKPHGKEMCIPKEENNESKENAKVQGANEDCIVLE